MRIPSPEPQPRDFALEARRALDELARLSELERADLVQFVRDHQEREAARRDQVRANLVAWHGEAVVAAMEAQASRRRSLDLLVEVGLRDLQSASADRYTRRFAAEIGVTELDSATVESVWEVLRRFPGPPRMHWIDGDLDGHAILANETIPIADRRHLVGVLKEGQEQKEREKWLAKTTPENPVAYLRKGIVRAAEKHRALYGTDDVLGYEDLSEFEVDHDAVKHLRRAQPLPCVDCGVTLRAGIVYCPACGANVAAAHHWHRDERLRPVEFAGDQTLDPLDDGLEPGLRAVPVQSPEIALHLVWMDAAAHNDRERYYGRLVLAGRMKTDAREESGLSESEAKAFEQRAARRERARGSAFRK